LLIGEVELVAISTSGWVELREVPWGCLLLGRVACDWDVLGLPYFSPILSSNKWPGARAGERSFVAE